MRQFFLRHAVVAALCLSFFATAFAHEYTVGSLEIVHPVARPSMGAAANSAVYLTVHNDGDEDRLVGVASDVADRVELHTTVMEDGVLKMQALEDGVVVPADGDLMLETGGDHVMLMGLAEPLAVGDVFTLTLEFEHAGAIDIEVEVVDPSQLGEAMEMHD